ncbi:MAG: transporter substrate-binding domain-containing protein [Sedimentisphaerales bacterium]|nr:transporter substrate-binding domain-containing protein [Sedimentisphaerales bacterium]MBN2843537.1 transporter substrate-binding domain-containing protein [Sedimentisphaerales bacterium]
MKKLTTIWRYFILIVVMTLAVNGWLIAAGPEHKDILILDSYYTGYKWCDLLISDLTDVLAETIDIKDYTLHIEHIDSRVEQSDNNKTEQAQMLQIKYGKVSLDLVILLGEGTKDFAGDYLADNILHAVPAISYCGNHYAPTTNHLAVSTDKYLTCDLDAQLGTIRQLLPDLEEIVVIAGRNESFYITAFEEYLAQNEEPGQGVPLDFLSGKEITTRQLYDQVETVIGNKAIIFAGWSGCADNIFTDTYYICHKVSEESDVPVFVLSSDYIGTGAVGGYLLSVENAGWTIGQMAISELGYKYPHIKVERELCSHFFVLDELLKWNIPVSALPAGSEVIDARHVAGNHDEGSGQAGDLTPQENQWLAENPFASVAILVRPPLIMPGDKPAGLAIDYISLLAEKAGLVLEYDFSYNSIEDYMKAAKEGTGPDIVAAIEYSNYRSEHLLFSKDWISMYFSVFVNKSAQGHNIDSISSLTGKVIAVDRGGYVHEMLTKDNSGISVLLVNNVLEGLESVASGLAWGWLGNQTAGLYCINKYDIDNVRLEATLYELGRNDLSFAVRRDKEFLFSILNKQAARVSVGEMDQLRRKYSDDASYSTGISTELVVDFILVTTVIFALALSVVLFRIRKAALLVSANKEKLSIAFESIGDAVVVIDQKFQIVRVNREALKLAGCDYSEVTDKLFDEVFELVDALTMDHVTLPLKQVMASGFAVSDSVAALIAKDGHRSYISYNINPIKTDVGQCSGVVVFLRDITDSYENSYRMKRAEKERDIIFDNITVGVCFYDEHFRPVRYNKQMEKFCGQVIHERFRHASEAEVEIVLPKQMRKFNVSKGADDDSSGYELEVTSMPLLDGDKVMGVLEMVVDVTEYQRLQFELERAYQELSYYSGSLEQQVKLRTFELQDRNDQLALAMDELKMAQGQLIMSEKMAALGQLISGISQEINTPLEVIAASVSTIRQSIEHLVNNFLAVEECFNGVNGQLAEELLQFAVNYRNSGVTLSTRENRYVRQQLIAEFKNNGINDNTEYFASVFINMGVESNWQYYLPLLKQDNALKLIHEISGIVNISGSCAMVLTAVGNASQIVRALKSYVHKSSYNSKNEMGRSLIDIASGIKTVLILFNSKLKNKIEVQLDLQEIPMVKGVSDEVNQVWTNIIQNAISAMPSGGVLSVSAYRYQGGARVVFADNGCGMTPEVKARLFEPFFTTKPQGQGTGLGMDIVRRIIEDNLHGTIDFESQEGQGTTFTIWLPAVPEKE